jgi:hypothetical protein
MQRGGAVGLVMVCALSITASACGGRSPLDSDINGSYGPGTTGGTTTSPTADASSGADGGVTFVGGDDASVTTEPAPVDGSAPTTPSVDAAPASDAAATKDSWIDIFDVLPIPDSGPIGACATCIKDSCSMQVNDCVNDATCRAGVQCTLMKCLGGMGGGGGGGGGFGGIDPACALGCFGGDYTKALAAVAVFQCVTSTCGSQCGSLLGGAGGGPGGGGGGGGGAGGAENPGAFASDPAAARVQASMAQISLAPEAVGSLRAEFCGAR